MANKRVNDLVDASLPIVGTDKILVSRDGIVLNKANALDLPVSAAVRYYLNSYQSNLPPPILVEQYSDTTGITFATNSTNNMAVDGAVYTQGNGVSATLLVTKTKTGPYNVSGFNTIAYLVDRPLTNVSSVSGQQFTISRGATTVTKTLNDMASKFRAGKRWMAVSMDDPELSTIKALTYGTITISPRVNQSTPFTAVFGVDNLYVNAKGRPQIIITFDDATNTIINTVFPLMTQRGMKGTAFIPKNNIGNTNRLTLSDLNTLYSYGWDLGSNTTTDASITSFATPTDAANNLMENMDYLYQNGFSRGTEFMALSNGVWRDTNGGETYISALQNAGIKMARTTEPDGIYTRFGFADTAMTIPSKGFSSSTTLQSAKDLVDRALLIGQSQWFHFHDISDSPSAIGWQTSNFIALLDYIKSFSDLNQLDVLTTSEFYNRTINSTIPGNNVVSY